jgi:hypothetical protein
MHSVTCSMKVSLDGYIAGPDGDFSWTAPDQEVFRFVTDGGIPLFPQRDPGLTGNHESELRRNQLHALTMHLRRRRIKSSGGWTRAGLPRP